MSKFNSPTRNTAPDYTKSVPTPGVLGPLDRFLEQFEARVSAGRALVPPLSPLYRHASMLRRQPTGNDQRVAQIVASEPVLVGAVLKQASSLSPSASGKPILDLDVAIKALGTRTLISIIESTTHSGFEEKHPDVCRHQLRKMWTNTIFTANAALEIAKWVGIESPNHIYSMAMLHNIGEPMLIAGLTEVLDSDPLAFPDATDFAQFIDSHHDKIGSQLLESWGLPQELVDYTRNHRGPANTIDGAVITVANECAHRYGYSYPTAHHNPQRLKQGLKKLRLDESLVDSLLDIIGPALNRTLSITRLF